MKEQSALKSFVDQVRWLYEPEYGDFKRKLGLYLKRLVESEPTFAQGPGAKLIEDLKNQVVFNPNGDIEATRRQILKTAEEWLKANSGSLH